MEEVYGTDNFGMGFNFHYGEGFDDPKYSAVLFLDHIVRGKELGVLEGPMDTSISGPIMFAALNPDYWTRENEVSSLSMPKLRLEAILQHAVKCPPESGKNYDFEYGWDYAQAIVKELFGISTTEIIAKDIEKQEQHLDRYDKVNSILQESLGESYPPCLAEQDVLRLRKEMFAIFKDDPAQFADPRVYITRLAPKVSVPIVWVDSMGLDLENTSNMEPITYQCSEENKNIGLIYSRLDMTAYGAAPLALRDGPTWLQMSLTFARIARLSLEGMQYKSLIGLDLVQGIKHLDDNYLGRFKVHRRFGPAIHGMSWAQLWSDRKQGGVFCDLCSVELTFERYESISGLAFHTIDKVRHALKLSIDNDAWWLLQHDWGDWKVCSDCYGALGI